MVISHRGHESEGIRTIDTISIAETLEALPWRRSTAGPVPTGWAFPAASYAGHSAANGSMLDSSIDLAAAVARAV
jgi:hypothetical protein